MPKTCVIPQLVSYNNNNIIITIIFIMCLIGWKTAGAKLVSQSQGEAIEMTLIISILFWKLLSQSKVISLKTKINHNHQGTLLYPLTIACFH